MRKVILHGCTNMGSTNFGDFLFADMVYTYVANYNKTGKTRFWQLSDFFRIKIFGSNDIERFNIFQMDALIYIPGGYFGEEQVPTVKSRAIRFIRYMPIGIFAAILQKPIAVIGVGAGPINSLILKKIIRFIFKRANVITVRDEESRQYLSEIGVNSDINVLSDLVLSFDQKLMPALNKSYVEKIDKTMDKRKIILVHYNESIVAERMFAKAVKCFLERHNDYGVIVSSDAVIENEGILFNEYAVAVDTQHILLHKYKDPWELCSVINICDVVLTTKLHVGIVAMRLGKSVLSFPIHKNKTSRLYKQINEVDRCVPLDAVDENIIIDKLEAYHDKKITINKELHNASSSNWDYLKSFLDALD